MSVIGNSIQLSAHKLARYIRADGRHCPLGAVYLATRKYRDYCSGVPALLSPSRLDRRNMRRRCSTRRYLSPFEQSGPQPAPTPILIKTSARNLAKAPHLRSTYRLLLINKST
jgi:hypothetical protein